MAFGDSEFAQRQEGAVSSLSISHPPCKVIAPPSCMAPDSLKVLTFHYFLGSS